MYPVLCYHYSLSKQDSNTLIRGMVMRTKNMHGILFFHMGWGSDWKKKSQWVEFHSEGATLPPIHLLLIFEISSSRNWFLNLIFELDYLSISNLIFTACVPAKINFDIDFCRLKIRFVEIDFSNLIFQNWSTDQQAQNRITK